LANERNGLAAVENLTTKILKRYLTADYRPGEEIDLRVDQVLLQDATGTMACLQFEELGRRQTIGRRESDRWRGRPGISDYPARAWGRAG